MKQKLQSTRLLRHLLTLVLVFTCIIGVSAAEASYKIEFLNGTTDTGTQITNKTNITDVVDASSPNYINTFTTYVQAYYKSKHGVRLASTNNPGCFAFSLLAAGQKKITKIVVEAYPYSGATNVSLKVTLKGDGTDVIKSFSVTETKPATTQTIEIDKQITVNSIQFDAAKNKRCQIKSITLYYEEADPVATPTFSPAAGEVMMGTKVTISTATEGATIHYTIDGNDPTVDSEVFNSSNPIVINAATTIKAIAVKDGNSSEVATATYNVVNVTAPTFSPESGTVLMKGSTVTITAAPSDAKIYYTYTTDVTTPPSDPTASSTEYTAPIAIDKATTIKAIAVKDGESSEVATASYTIAKVATPTFSLAAGGVPEGSQVTISTTTPDAKIYYTTDPDAIPSASSTEYTAPIVINEAMTIKAIAVKTGMDDSDIATAEYTIKNSSTFIFVGEGTPSNYYGLPYKEYADNGTTIKSDPVTINLNAKAAEAWRIWDDGLRAYTSHTPNFTVSGTDIKIKSVTINVAKALSFKKDNEPEESISANKSHKFDCFGARSVSFTVSGTSGHAIISIDVEWEKAVIQNPVITFGHEQEGFNASQTLTYAMHDHESAKAPTLIHNMPGIPEFTYTSSKPEVATVDAKTGAISLIGVGSTSIEAAFAGNEDYNPAKASYMLNVTKGTTELMMDVKANMKVGETAEVAYLTNLPAHLLKDVVLTSSEPAVLKVEGNKITALDSGIATLTATYPDSQHMSGATDTSSEITVEYTMEDAPIQWANDAISCVINNITQPELIGVPEGVQVSYSIYDKSIATVSDDGKIIPHIPGMFMLTAKWPESQKDATTRYNAGQTDCIIELLSIAESERKEGDPKIPTIEIAEGNDTEEGLKLSVLCYSITDGFWYIGYNKSLKLKLHTSEAGATIKYRFVAGTVDFDDITNRKARVQEETPWEDYNPDSSIDFTNSESNSGKTGTLEFKAVNGALESPVETLKVSITTGVDNIEADGNDGEARYFNLQGVEVKNPGNGIFIRIADGKAVKVIR